MSDTVVEAAALIFVAVTLLVAVTTVALRRSTASTGAGSARRWQVASLTALPMWGGVLAVVVLATRGRLALGGIVLGATVLYVGIMRFRLALASRSR